MGSSFSSRRDVYVHQFVNPRVEERQDQIMLRMSTVSGETNLVFSNGRMEMNPFEIFVSEKDDAQRALITGIHVLFINNESDEPVTIQIKHLFAAGENDDVKHIDDSGEIDILCPAKYNQPVRGNDRILYKPRLKEDILKCYAGLENAILKEYAVPVDQKEEKLDLLELSHPLVHFIMTNQDTLQPEHGDIVKHEPSGFFELKPDFVTKVRQFFSNHILKDMHSTRFEETLVTAHRQTAYKGQDQPNVVIILQMDYLLVTPGDGKMKHAEIKL